MNEITDQNFKCVYQEVQNALKDAAFIAIDSEFSGIKSETHFKESLFDSSQDRYVKLRKNIEPFIIMQYGITTFHRVQSENTYKAKCFNFFLLPRSTPFKNRQFSWQASAIEFLSTYSFDFNKFASEGISYLNEEEEALLKEELGKNELTRNVERYVSYKDEDDLKDYKFQINDWLNRKSETASFQIKIGSPILQYIVHKELRSRFNNIWTICGHKTVIVVKVAPNLRHILEEEEDNVLENELLDSYIGFSKVFKLLVSLKKPIIGHNLLLDLMFMHQQFYKPLPTRYSDFKRSIHRLFPIIYDTKFLSFELREILLREEKWKLNSLDGMYKYFTEGQGKHIVLNSPCIELCDKSTDEKKIHNAGWDAYFAGYIFIKMAHIFAVKKYGQGLEQRTPTHTELISSITKFANCVNLIRGNVSYLKLDGPDPESARPEWLCVKALQSQTLNVSQIAEKFSTFGTVDVMPFSRQRILVAVASHGSARDILKHFKYNTELRVAPYSPIRYRIPRTMVLWGGAILSGGMLAWILHRTFQKSV